MAITNCVRVQIRSQSQWFGAHFLSMCLTLLFPVCCYSIMSGLQFWELETFQKILDYTSLVSNIQDTLLLTRLIIIVLHTFSFIPGFLQPASQPTNTIFLDLLIPISRIPWLAQPLVSFWNQNPYSSKSLKLGKSAFPSHFRYSQRSCKIKELNGIQIQWDPVRVFISEVFQTVL